MAEPLPYPDPPLAAPGFVLRRYRREDVAPDRDAVDHPSSARWLNPHSSGDADGDLQRLQLRIDPANDASHAVALRAGYEREGTLRSAFVVRGRRTDVVMYSRLPTDPQVEP